MVSVSDSQDVQSYLPRLTARSPDSVSPFNRLFRRNGWGIFLRSCVVGSYVDFPTLKNRRTEVFMGNMEITLLFLRHVRTRPGVPFRTPLTVPTPPISGTDPGTQEVDVQGSLARVRRLVPSPVTPTPTWVETHVPTILCPALFLPPPRRVTDEVLVPWRTRGTDSDPGKLDETDEGVISSPWYSPFWDQSFRRHRSPCSRRGPYVQSSTYSEKVLYLPTTYLPTIYLSPYLPPTYLPLYLFVYLSITSHYLPPTYYLPTYLSTRLLPTYYLATHCLLTTYHLPATFLPPYYLSISHILVYSPTYLSTTFSLPTT